MTVKAVFGVNDPSDNFKIEKRIDQAKVVYLVVYSVTMICTVIAYYTRFLYMLSSGDNTEPIALYHKVFLW